MEKNKMLENKEKIMEEDEEEMTVEEYKRLHPEMMKDDWNMGMSEFEYAAFNKTCEDEYPELMEIGRNLDAMIEERQKEQEIMNKVHERSGKAKVVAFPRKK